MTSECECLNYLLKATSVREFVRSPSYVDTRVWTVASLTYKQQKHVCELFIRDIFSPRVIFAWSLHICVILARKCSVTLHCKLHFLVLLIIGVPLVAVIMYFFGQNAHDPGNDAWEKTLANNAIGVIFKTRKYMKLLVGYFF